MVACYRPCRRLVNKPNFRERLSFANRHALNGIALTNRIDDILTSNHFAEHGMAPIQVRLGRVRDEKLAAIGVRSRIGHRQRTGFVAQWVIGQFIFESIAGTAGAATGGIAALDHEIRNDTMKANAIIEAGARQKHEIVNRLRGVFRIQIEIDRALACFERAAIGLAAVDLHLRRCIPALSHCSISRNFVNTPCANEAVPASVVSSGDRAVLHVFTKF